MDIRSSFDRADEPSRQERLISCISCSLTLSIEFDYGLFWTTLVLLGWGRLAGMEFTVTGYQARMSHISCISCSLTPF